ncbi:hypothetical protein [Sphingopyxis panaciterrae]
MKQAPFLAYFRGRWPEEEIPDGEPEWVRYETSYEQDAVLRAVNIYRDGRITRNSIEIEERNGDRCPSLIDCSLTEGFADAPLKEIDRDEFEEHWERGTDEPFWFVR